MSWSTYVESNLLGTGKVSKAAIHGHDGKPWATSKGFTVSSDECAKLVKGFTDPSALRASGLFIGGTKFILLRADDRSIYGKQGATGIIAVKTKQAVLIGFYPEGVQPGAATKVVEDLGDYLISVSY
ncbi:Profilin/allergen [Gonapodya prolifera JEL478]|uniref:Profilin n=1 Tax=Gonapodya prolifera (strain JEL478) TaxID=1344416 RepID=A0A139B0C6_GONPJ|nr:Profilin/allergen [Gonapodya prolifera JEL478]|eukprot:KXS22448.1 Profilin/allergen [Gonapodya prolifera JEL478]